MKVNRKGLLGKICFCFCVLFIFLRTFIVSYISGYIKYVFFAIYIITGFIAILSIKKFKAIKTNDILLIALFVFYTIINSSLLGGKELLFLSIKDYCLWILPFFIIPLLIKIVKWDRLLHFLVVFGVVDSATSIIEFATKKQLFPLLTSKENVLVNFGSYSVTRTYGLNGNYFLLAMVLSLCGLVSFSLFWIEKKRIYLVAWAFISIGVLTTGSRGYYVAYGVGLIYLFLSEKASKGFTAKKLINWIAFFSIIAILFLIIFETNFSTGISAIDTILFRARLITNWTDESANLQRVTRWGIAFSKWMQKPLFGWGASSTSTDYSQYVEVTESGILKRLVELGLFGTLLQYLTIFVPLLRAYRYHRADKSKNPVALLCFAIIVSLMVEDIILQCYTSMEYTIILWTCITIPLNIYTTKTDQENNDNLFVRKRNYEMFSIGERK